MNVSARSTAVLILVSLLFTTLACGGDLVPPREETANGAPASAAAPSPAAPAGGSSGQRIEARGLVFDLPADWTPEPPESSMRLVQASIRGSGGGGQFTVFHFGEGGGGGVEPNLQRWIGQMERASSEEPERQIVEVGAYRATWVDVDGTLEASTIGSFPPTDMPGYTLFGAVVEGPGGPWFLRAVGPQETMDAHRDAFVAMLRSARGA